MPASTRSPDSVNTAPRAILSTGRSTRKRRRLACTERFPRRVTATGRLGDSGEAQRLIKTLGFIGVVKEPSAPTNVGPVAANPQ
jgi:hypothetical protein